MNRTAACFLVVIFSLSSLVIASPRHHTVRRQTTTTNPTRPQTLPERMCAAASQPGNEAAYAETVWEEVYSPRDRWLVDAMREHYHLPDPDRQPSPRVFRVRQLHQITARVEREIQRGGTCNINGGPIATAATIRGQRDVSDDAFGYGGTSGAGTSWGGTRLLPGNRCNIMVMRFRANFPLRTWCGIHADHPAETNIVPGSQITLVQTRVATDSSVPAPTSPMPEATSGRDGIVSPFGAMDGSGY